MGEGYDCKWILKYWERGTSTVQQVYVTAYAPRCFQRKESVRGQIFCISGTNAKRFVTKAPYRRTIISLITPNSPELLGTPQYLAWGFQLWWSCVSKLFYGSANTRNTWYFSSKGVLRLQGLLNMRLRIAVLVEAWGAGDIGQAPGHKRDSSGVV